ncbi:hypothetical protein PMIN04_012887 [Paraphaeosphaeria minitans]|uniref:BTB domain-containing protein n=1 Tax=Paraphaeosphaeria minitans TaxID=565426 RepID=A0A9P6G7Y9_9PLEO|nr:hypothetical protein PMIN01_12209 [Paraphaeosphaeria minitans]
MAPTFEDFIQSHQFTFFIGQEGKPIVVHAAAIAATSQQLDALINGGMEESATHCARIEDVKFDDFIRFCEYAYRGDYTTPPWEAALPEPSSTSSKGQHNGDDDPWGVLMSKKTKGKKGKAVRVPEIYDEPAPEIPVYDEPAPNGDDDCTADPAPEPSCETAPVSRTPLRTQFNSRTCLHDGGPKAKILQHFEPKPNTAVDQNFTPVLLAHARLYCFAHLRLIEPLKALTLDKLHKTLMNFKLFTRRVRDIIELARFAYLNPDLPERRDDGTIDDLRKLVVQYIVCEIDTIGKCDEFVKYMEEGGEFVGDFWRMARDYMV